MNKAKEIMQEVKLECDKYQLKTTKEYMQQVAATIYHPLTSDYLKQLVFDIDAAFKETGSEDGDFVKVYNEFRHSVEELQEKAQRRELL